MKRILTLITLSVLGLIVLVACTQKEIVKMEGETLNIIPKPQHVEVHRGGFKVSPTMDYTLEGAFDHSQFIESFLTSLFPGVALEMKNGSDINLVIDMAQSFPAEGYRLEVNERKILITAGDEPGIFYGLQTLRQMLPASNELPNSSVVDAVVQAGVVVDSPRFGWRGMHLDVSRHFFPVEFVKQYIDMIAMHKMNTFHWHLTDDNGWRLEIKQYPELTEICAWRVDREHEPWREWSPIKPGEKATYGGFYTQEEVKQVIAYAAERQIEVIPEIEMPGHSSELFSAFPELSCEGEFFHVRPGSYWPNEKILCGGNDSVFVFLQNVIDEVAELFPSKYIHIGGDEAHKKKWEECPKCQARIKAENLADEHELQSWFIHKMEAYIHAKGKTIIGWDEILEGGLAPNATVMSWRGEKGGIAAAKAGHDVIMTPYSHVYFDYYQGPPENEPLAIGGDLPVTKVYSYEPIPEELTPEEHKYVLGAQANLWTEFVKTTSHAEYMVLPRMTALSEVLWSDPEAREWGEFSDRLETLMPRFENLDWNYRPLDKE